MSAYVLVHGGFHGGWSWELVSPQLARAGHRVLTPDLPGHGEDATPQPDITYDMAVGRIREVVEAAGEPVILAGHSMSGLLISRVAEEIPHRVKMLVWIGAFLVPSGYSLKEYLDAHRELGESQVLPNTTLSADGSHATFNVAKAREVFYNTTPEVLAAKAVARLRPVAIPYLVTPVRLTAQNFGRVPRAYVICLRDRCIPPAMQRRMIADQPCRHVFELDTDHSPFECQPERLAQCLIECDQPKGE